MEDEIDGVLFNCNEKIPIEEARFYVQKMKKEYGNSLYSIKAIVKDDFLGHVILLKVNIAYKDTFKFCRPS